MTQPQPILCVISLGAGVQSTTMALMAAHGEIAPMPDCAIFADTGWEPRAVYEHLAWLRSPGVLPFPVHVGRCTGAEDLGRRKTVRRHLRRKRPISENSSSGRRLGGKWPSCGMPLAPFSSV